MPLEHIQLEILPALVDLPVVNIMLLSGKYDQKPFNIVKNIQVFMILMSFFYISLWAIYRNYPGSSP